MRHKKAEIRMYSQNWSNLPNSLICSCQLTEYRLDFPRGRRIISSLQGPCLHLRICHSMKFATGIKYKRRKESNNFHVSYYAELTQQSKPLKTRLSKHRKYPGQVLWRWSNSNINKWFPADSSPGGLTTGALAPADSFTWRIHHPADSPPGRLITRRIYHPADSPPGGFPTWLNHHPANSPPGWFTT